MLMFGAYADNSELLHQGNIDSFQQIKLQQ